MARRKKRCKFGKGKVGRRKGQCLKNKRVKRCAYYEYSASGKKVCASRGSTRGFRSRSSAPLNYRPFGGY